MKNFSKIFCAIFLLSASPSFATGIFVGVDALNADARFKATNSSSLSGPKNHSIAEADKRNYGVNAGVRVDFLNLLASAELFYDDLRTSSRDFENNSNHLNQGDSMALKNRYGIKGNFGFAILPRITPFLTYGLTNVRYESNLPSSGNSISKTEFAPLYGIGILFDLPLGISAKASYDYQQFHASYAASGARVKTQLGVVKLGLIYNF